MSKNAVKNAKNSKKIIDKNSNEKYNENTFLYFLIIFIMKFFSTNLKNNRLHRNFFEKFDLNVTIHG